MTGSRVRGMALHAVLWLGAAVMMFPFYWMAVMATNSTSDIYRFPPKPTACGDIGSGARYAGP